MRASSAYVTASSGFSSTASAGGGITASSASAILRSCWPTYFKSTLKVRKLIESVDPSKGHNAGHAVDRDDIVSLPPGCESGTSYEIAYKVIVSLVSL